MQISSNAVEGNQGPSTFSLILQISGKRAVALVDSGSSDTFMITQFAIDSNCTQKSVTPRSVAVVGGGKLISDSYVPEIQCKVQNTTFKPAFKILPLVNYDVILGADWILQHGPIYMDLIKRILVVTKQGHSVVLKDYTQLEKQSMLSAVQLQKML